MKLETKNRMSPASIPWRPQSAGLCVHCAKAKAVKVRGEYRLRCRVKQHVVDEKSPDCAEYEPGPPFAEVN